MRFLSTILAFIIFALTAKPCSDGQNLEDLHDRVSDIEHNHREDSDDSCPITCICNCCGMSITCTPLVSFELTIVYTKITKDIVNTYQTIYNFNFQSNIWQPPKVIS